MYKLREQEQSTGIHTRHFSRIFRKSWPIKYLNKQIFLHILQYPGRLSTIWLKNLEKSLWFRKIILNHLYLYPLYLPSITILVTCTN